MTDSWLRCRRCKAAGRSSSAAIYTRSPLVGCCAAGALDFTGNPITVALAGPVGTERGLWPSAFRGVGATPPAHLDMREEVRPIEQHGFTLADFLPDRIVLRLFKWDIKTQSPDAIDPLEPFHTTELGRI